MFGEFSGTSLVLLDTVRWIIIIWLVVSMGWLIQLAVITRLRSVGFLAAGLCLSLFLDIEGQYERLGVDSVSYRLPMLVIELILITVGMYWYVRLAPAVEFVRPFYFFLRVRRSDRKDAP